MKKIAQMTDLHIDDFLAKEYRIDARKNFEKALKLAQRRNVSTVIITGDLGVPEAIPWIIEEVKSRGFGLHIALGNHDHTADFQHFDFLEPLFKDDGLYFLETIDGLEFNCLFLDSSAEEIGKAQLDWLGQQLSGSKEPVLVFIHHPILDCGNTIMDRLFPLRKRDDVKQVLLESDREISILCGHCHYREAVESKQEKLRQFLTPSIAGQIKKDGEKIEPDSGYLAYREIWMIDKKLYTEVVEFK